MTEPKTITADQIAKALRDSLFKANSNRRGGKTNSPPPADIERAKHIVDATRLDPFRNQLYFIYRYPKSQSASIPTLTVQTSIDGLRITAERTGRYEGQSNVEWLYPDGKWRDYWHPSHKDARPIAARVGVYKKGFQQVLTAVAHFAEYVGTSHFWTQKPALMLAKCAEALALRKAFPEELSGLYTSEEMQQADDNADTSVLDESESSAEPVSTPKILDKDSRATLLSRLNLLKAQTSQEAFDDLLSRLEAQGLMNDRRLAAEIPENLLDAFDYELTKTPTTAPADTANAELLNQNQLAHIESLFVTSGHPAHVTSARQQFVVKFGGDPAEVAAEKYEEILDWFETDAVEPF